MQVIVPMTGYGSRFKAAGYKDLKPFIEVCGKPMIEWVLKMYPQTTKFILVMRKSTYEEYDTVLSGIIQRSGQYVKIVSLPDEEWKKEGPAIDALQALPCLNPTDSVFVNYCDFFCIWNAIKFDAEAKARKVVGAIPCYTGFHPHLIPEKNVYASCKINKKGRLKEIKEKFSFEKDKTKAHHSPGIYWFENPYALSMAVHLAKTFKLKLNGEYYMSLPYNCLRKVWVSDCVPYFCQWGTPEDLKEFELWMSELGGKN